MGQGFTGCCHFPFPAAVGLHQCLPILLTRKKVWFCFPSGTRRCVEFQWTTVLFLQPTPQRNFLKVLSRLPHEPLVGLPGDWWDLSMPAQPPELHTSSYSAFSNSLNILTFNLLNSAPHTNPLPAQVQGPCSYLSPVFRIVFCLDLGSPWVQEKSLIFCFSSFFLVVRVGVMFFPALYSC